MQWVGTQYARFMFCCLQTSKCNIFNIKKEIELKVIHYTTIMFTNYFAQFGTCHLQMMLMRLHCATSGHAPKNKAAHIVIIPSHFVYCSEVEDGFHMGPLRTFQMLGSDLEMQQNVTLSNPS